MSPRANWWVAATALASFVAGLALSHRIEPGVRVEAVTVAGDTPALRFSPASQGPHPVALLAHGFGGSKENLSCYAEALALAGFECFCVDQPGHGASPRLYTLVEAARTLGEVDRAIGPVDVYVGHSMGGITGGEAVLEGRLKPKLFIALGSDPRLGEHAPPLLFLAGRFEEFFPPAELRARTDARLVLSPWSDHLLEAFDPLLVNAAVEAACATVGRTPPPAPTWLLWRLAGMVLAVIGAVKLALCLPQLFPRLAPVRGLLAAAGLLGALVLATRSRVEVTPHLHQLPLQLAGIVITFVVLRGASRLRVPRWSFFVLAAVVAGVAIAWVLARRSYLAVRVAFFALTFCPALVAAAVVGGLVARRGSRLDSDVAMAIIMGCALFQQNHLPRTPPEVLRPHVVVKLDTQLLDACAGRYEFAPNNVFRAGATVRLWRQGEQMFLQATGRRVLQGVWEIYPESETNFFLKVDGAELTFIKGANGEVTSVIHHQEGLPDSEGRKLSEKDQP